MHFLSMSCLCCRPLKPPPATYQCCLLSSLSMISDEIVCSEAFRVPSSEYAFLWSDVRHSCLVTSRSWVGSLDNAESLLANVEDLEDVSPRYSVRAWKVYVQHSSISRMWRQGYRRGCCLGTGWHQRPCQSHFQGQPSQVVPFRWLSWCLPQRP